MNNINTNNSDNSALKKKNKIYEKEKTENNINEDINSPQLIQLMLHFDNLNKNTKKTQILNKTIKNLTSLNNTILQVLDNNNEDNNINPYIEFSKQKNDIYKLNFDDNNYKQKELNNIIEQYKELYTKIVNYNKNLELKNNINNISSHETQIANKNENNLVEELFIVNHPLVNLFEKEININELKNNINNKYKVNNNNFSIEEPTNITNEYLIGIKSDEDFNNDLDGISDDTSIIYYSSYNSNNNSIISQNDE